MVVFLEKKSSTRQILTHFLCDGENKRKASYDFLFNWPSWFARVTNSQDKFLPGRRRALHANNNYIDQ